MKRWLKIQCEPIDETTLNRERMVSKGVGAIICFLGIVREQEGNESISAIEYDAFEKMAAHQFAKIFDAMETRWPIESVRLVHRIGMVPVNEASLWVEAAAPHRGEAFAACQYLIDEMKKVVPIWKRPIPSSARLS
jgi:molybdopterin synthase catalytic subunit